MRCLTETRTGHYLVNEDRFLCDSERSFFAILDGEVHEGHAAIAALELLRSASPTIAHVLRRSPEWAIKTMASLVKRANQMLFRDANANPRWRGAGTTLTCVGLSQESIVIAHVGDSRAYARDSSGWRCLTNDHTLVAEARRANHPDLALLLAEHSNVITRIVGVTPDVEVETHQLSRDGVSALLCTDGFWRPLDPDLSYAPLPNLGDHELLDFAFLAFENDGQRDNASCVLVSW